MQENFKDTNHIEVNADFEDNHVATFLKWLQNNDTTGIHNFDDTGRGMMANRDIQPGDTIISIPAFFFIDTSVIYDSDLMLVFNSSKNRPTAIEALSVFLLWERSKGATSHWYDYINVLPESFNLPLFWSHEEVMLLPKTLQNDVFIQKDKVHKSFRKIKGILKQHNAILNSKTKFDSIINTNVNSKSISYQNFNSNDTKLSISPNIISRLTLNDFHWAWSVVNSRGAYKQTPSKAWLDPSEPDNVVVVPLLDMFNHSTSAQVEAGFDESTGCYLIKSLIAFEKGSQVFINYGAHDSKTLLLDYGFICPHNINDCIYFELTDLVAKAGKYNVGMLEDKVLAIRDNKFDKHLYFSIEGLSWNLTQSLLVLTADFYKNSQKTQNLGDSTDFNKQAKQIIKDLSKDVLDELPAKHFHEIKGNPLHLRMAEELYDMNRSIVENIVAD